MSDGFSHLYTSFQWGGTFPMSVTSPSVWPSRGFLNTFPPGLDIGANLLPVYTSANVGGNERRASLRALSVSAPTNLMHKRARS